MSSSGERRGSDSSKDQPHPAVSEQTDAALLAAWSDGDKASGRVLYRRYYRFLLRFYFNKVGPDTTDLVQTTFLALVESASRYRPEGSFKSWLLGISRRVLSKHFEKQYRHGPPVENRSVVDMGTSPSAMAARYEQHRQLLEALRRLTLEQQIVLELHYWEGMTNLQIAEALELPLGTVQSRIRRAREQLARTMAAQPGASDRTSISGGLEDWATRVRGSLLDDEPVH